MLVRGHMPRGRWLAIGGPPSSTSASKSGLSHPVLPRRLWRVVSWVGLLLDVIGGVSLCGNVGGMKDDVVIALQLAVYYSERPDLYA